MLVLKQGETGPDLLRVPVFVFLHILYNECVLSFTHRLTGDIFQYCHKQLVKSHVM